MKPFIFALASIFLTLSAAPVTVASAQAPDNSEVSQAYREAMSLPWVVGPKDVPIADQAKLSLTKGYKYLGSTDTDRFLQINGNPPTYGAFTLAQPDLNWFAVYQFEDTGYVKDDERIDSEALLRELKSQDGPSNEERRRLGLPALYTIGWSVKPHYDAETHNLEWGVSLQSDDGQKVENYTTRVLGREGVMKVILVSSPDTLTADIAEFKKASLGFSYLPTQTYESFREGDKVAAYGLGALVVGGAAAAVVKSGAGKGFFALLAGLGKLIFVAIAAAFLGALGWLKSRFWGRATAE